MAVRRAFNVAIVESDAFIEMPISAQALYFHLGMKADDDGFIGSPNVVMRTIGSTADDLTLLLAKRFLLKFENGVVVIKHWKIHNTIKNDRYHPTVYTEEFKLLRVKENSSYTDKKIDGSKMEPIVLQTGSNSEPESNLIESNLKERTAFFSKFWDKYPNKKNKQGALKSFKRLDVSEDLFKLIMSGLESWRASKDWQKDDGQFIPHAQTWLNNRRWEDDLKVEKLKKSWNEL